MRTSFLVVLTALLLLANAPSLAQAQQVATPGPEHAMLKALEGEWDAVIKFGTEESKATAKMRLGLGGFWLLTEFQGSAGGAPFEGHGIDGYDQDKKKYTSIWVDSMSSSAMTFEGTYDERTKTTTMFGQGKGPDGSPARYKTTTVVQDNDHQTFQMFVLDAAGEPQLMMTITYTRKKTSK